MQAYGNGVALWFASEIEANQFYNNGAIELPSEMGNGFVAMSTEKKLLDYLARPIVKKLVAKGVTGFIRGGTWRMAQAMARGKMESLFTREVFLLDKPIVKREMSIGNSDFSDIPCNHTYSMLMGIASQIQQAREA